MIAYAVVGLLCAGAGFLLGLGCGGAMRETAREDEYHKGYEEGHHE
jgi:hypothetical protein